MKGELNTNNRKPIRQVLREHRGFFSAMAIVEAWCLANILCWIFLRFDLTDTIAGSFATWLGHFF